MIMMRLNFTLIEYNSQLGCEDLLHISLDNSCSVSDLKNPLTLREMYCDEGLSIGEIARMVGTTKSHVYYYMAKFGIKRRPWTGLTFKQNPSLILDLYQNHGKTLKEVSSILGISKSTARDHIAKKIHLRPRSTPRYRRTPFSGNKTEEAYLMGFRAGDVNAFQDSTLTVTARVSTTHRAMLEMFLVSFSQYGHCVAVPRRVFLTGYDWQVKVYLDNSFRFIIPRPLAPPLEPNLLHAFTAGLSDSDGCWSAWGKRGRTAFYFGVTSRNHELLMRLASALEKWNYHPRVNLSQKKGTVKLVEGREGSRRITLREDVWTLAIGRRDEIKRLALLVLPFSRHTEKIAKMKLFLDNRNEDWTEMGPRFERLRRRIRFETNKTISGAEIEYKARHGELASRGRRLDC